MTSSNVRKAWETPRLEEFGAMRELTATSAEPDPMGAPNAKLVGSNDGLPFQDCPPGLFKMDDDSCGNGLGGVS